MIQYTLARGRYYNRFRYNYSDWCNALGHGMGDPQLSHDFNGSRSIFHVMFGLSIVVRPEFKSVWSFVRSSTILTSMRRITCLLVLMFFTVT